MAVSSRRLYVRDAPVAQSDRASDFGSEGWGFESLRAHLHWVVTNGEANWPPRSSSRETGDAYVRAAPMPRKICDPACSTFCSAQCSDRMRRESQSRIVSPFELMAAWPMTAKQ